MKINVTHKGEIEINSSRVDCRFLCQLKFEQLRNRWSRVVEIIVLLDSSPSSSSSIVIVVLINNYIIIHKKVETQNFDLYNLCLPCDERRMSGDE